MHMATVWEGFLFGMGFAIGYGLIEGIAKCIVEHLKRQ